MLLDKDFHEGRRTGPGGGGGDDDDDGDRVMNDGDNDDE